MKIIIVGAGEVGRHLAEHLSTEAHDITIIEEIDALAGELDTLLDARVLAANGASVQSLLEAGVSECDLLLALTSDEDSNLVSCSLGKKLGAAKTISRVHPTLQREEWLFDHRGHFGIDYLFSSERLSAVELAKYIRNPESLLVEEIARGRIELQQVAISEQSDARGKSLLDLKLPPRIRIGTIQRGKTTIIPSAEESLEEGDLVTLFGEPRKLDPIVEKLQKGAPREDEKRVVIFGGGEYGFSLAQMLEGWNCQLRIFEQDPKICQELTHRLSRTTVINADATSLSELREEQVGNADFFVATTENDEDNVMTCLQAHNLGAERCLAIIHRADYADAISSSGEKIGIMAAVSPREAARRDLMRFITSERYHIIKSLGDTEVIEATIPKASPIADKKVAEVDWPKESGLVALVHDIHAAVPAADDVIKADDTIYAMVSKKAKRRFLRLVGR